MDVFTRRIIGFGVERACIDGVSVCRMFNHAIAGQPLLKRFEYPINRSWRIRGNCVVVSESS